jgi:hypothetical protein
MTEQQPTWEQAFPPEAERLLASVCETQLEAFTGGFFASLLWLELSVLPPYELDREAAKLVLQELCDALDPVSAQNLDLEPYRIDFAASVRVPSLFVTPGA